jgi:hypothetical protein
MTRFRLALSRPIAYTFESLSKRAWAPARGGAGSFTAQGAMLRNPSSGDFELCGLDYLRLAA